MAREEANLPTMLVIFKYNSNDFQGKRPYLFIGGDAPLEKG